jgi:high-affinity iron transporter
MRRGLATALVLLAGLAGAADHAVAATPPPWKAGAQVREALFDAQQALLLGERGKPAAVARAQRAYESGLAGSIRHADPVAHRDVVAGLRAARTADDGIALAAARGSVQAALYRGAAAVTYAAVAAGDAQTARAWLLLREFRTPTRYTRPGADATVALRELGRGRISPGRARLTVVKDLLDSTQGEARERLEEIGRLGERGFAAHRAELAAQVAGAWPLLAERYRAERGAQAERDAEAAVRQLRAAALRDDDAAVEVARADVARRLSGFTAAPFTAEEQARRANQLAKFVSLIPVEYDHGVEGKRVTVAFEIQEGLAFSTAAQAAFADLQGTLARIDARRTADVETRLKALDGVLRGAQKNPLGVPEVGTVKARGEAIGKRLAALFPDAWENQSDAGDFDLIQISLDRLEQQVAAGRYRQAEQTRVELYAIFEFGPERRLQAFDPALANDVEGLIWFGALKRPGLAELVAGRAPRREVKATREVLDDKLGDVAATLGDSASEATVITNAAIIVFREGLEAVLILAAITAGLLGTSRRKRRPVLLGALAGLGVSIVTFVLATTLLSSLQKYGEKLEAIVGLVAIAVLLLVMNWFFHKVYWTEWISSFHKRRRSLLARDEDARVAFFSAQVLGLFLLGLTSVYREGFETTLFLQSLELSAGLRATILGALLGLAATAVVAVATFRLQRKLPYKRMLIVTGVLLAFVLMVMVGATVRTMQGAGWLPIHSLDIQIPYWFGTWFGVFPTWETIGAQVAALAFVIGSYFAAEYVRIKRPRRRALRAVAEKQVPEAREEPQESSVSLLR